MDAAKKTMQRLLEEKQGDKVVVVISAMSIGAAIRKIKLLVRRTFGGRAARPTNAGLSVEAQPENVRGQAQKG
jgi:transposase-like protein